MEFTLGLAQVSWHAREGALARVRAWAERAAEAGVDLLVFPEFLQTPFEASKDEYLAAAEPLDGSFASGVDAIAAELGLWILYTANERDQEGGKPYNTAVLVDAGGRRRAVYRKTHLYDAGSEWESEKMQPGGRIFEPCDTPFGRLGLGICYDLRFPELARKQALGGCELLLYPAAWVAGPGKADQWQTLLKARAMENGIFVAGVSSTGGVRCGHSLVVGPFGQVLASAGVQEELLTVRIDCADVALARAAVPVLEHRRPELY